MNDITETELIKNIKQLEIVAKKNVTQLISGAAFAKKLGSGLEIDDTKKYTFGESIRFVDWNITARTGDLYLKTLKEERERHVLVLIDMSASMLFGTQQKSKRQFASEIAATLGYSANFFQDKFGMVLFDDRNMEAYLPAKGQLSFLMMIKKLLKYQTTISSESGSQGLLQSLKWVHALQNRKHIVFIVSDFIGQKLPSLLSLLSQKNDITLVHVYDLLEYTFSKKVILPFSSRLNFSMPFHGHFGQFDQLEHVQHTLQKQALDFGGNFLSVATTDSLNEKLSLFFHFKKMQRH